MSPEIIITPLVSPVADAVPMAVAKVAELANRHPYTAAAVGVATAGAATYAGVKLAMPHAKKGAGRLNQLRRTAQAKVSDWMKPKAERSAAEPPRAAAAAPELPPEYYAQAA